LCKGWYRMSINDDEDQVVIEENNDIEEEIVEKSDDSNETEPENEPATIQDEEDGDDDEDEDRVVTIGDPVPEPEGEADDSGEEKQKDPKLLVKKLRKVTRGLEKKNKALQKQIDANAQVAQVEKPVELGEEPTLAGCKYDDAKYKEEIRLYDARKRKVDEQTAKNAKIVEEQNENWQTKQKKYVDLKQEHSFKDFEDTEELVSTTFSQTQQGIIVSGADDAALLVYALGKNPKKLEELSKITDPVEFAFKVAKLETQLKVSSKKAPKPETRIKSGKSGGISGSSDKTLERLREEAARTGNYTKVTQYKNKLRKG